ncbi:hypothetical protein BT67DRAFT_273694 [Trichocladium antarcticum]|uniref:Uncharacterized protein n=1 Tax=Trichocladium antarcticum TaxID=1450529 RepID=A0AAN6ZFA6_9PEZI|nr:hypothetical protein BT67DRAFT_273694 [Trichocladium antarcticum]
MLWQRASGFRPWNPLDGLCVVDRPSVLGIACARSSWPNWFLISPPSKCQAGHEAAVVCENSRPGTPSPACPGRKRQVTTGGRLHSVLAPMPAAYVLPYRLPVCSWPVACSPDSVNLATPAPARGINVSIAGLSVASRPRSRTENIFNVETEPRCFPAREAHYNLSSVDSAVTVRPTTALGHTPLPSPQGHIPVKLSPPRGAPWIEILVAIIQGNPGRRFFSLVLRLDWTCPNYH